jgi:hypothetical protein
MKQPPVQFCTLSVAHQMVNKEKNKNNPCRVSLNNDLFYLKPQSFRLRRYIVTPFPEGHKSAQLR